MVIYQVVCTSRKRFKTLYFYSKKVFDNEIEAKEYIRDFGVSLVAKGILTQKGRRLAKFSVQKLDLYVSTVIRRY